MFQTLVIKKRKVWIVLPHQTSCLRNAKCGTINVKSIKENNEIALAHATNTERRREERLVSIGYQKLHPDFTPHVAFHYFNHFVFYLL